MKLKRLVAALLISSLLSLPYTTAAYAGPRLDLLANAHAAVQRPDVIKVDYSGYPVVPPIATSLVNTTYNDGTDGAFTQSDNSAPSFEWRDDMIAGQLIAKREEGLDMKGVIPELTDLYGSARGEINKKIESVTVAKIATAKEMKARSINFEYAVYDSDAMISIIVIATVTSSSSKKEVASVNFKPATGEIVGLSGAMGTDVKPLAEKLLTEKIRRNPDKFNAGFDKLPENQAFYMTDDQIVLLFNEFELIPGVEDITKLELNLSQITEVTISKSDYHTKTGYDLKMVPLQAICTGLDYESQWDSEEQRIDLYRNGTLIMELTPGVNNYRVFDKKMRSLETAPELINNSTYVPISFFDQILSLITYSVDSQDNITFLSYKDND